MGASARLPSYTEEEDTMARLNGSRITRARNHWRLAVEAGQVRCRRCHEIITPGQDWDLGHDHDLVLGGDPRGRMTPEHARKADCPMGGNRSAGASLGNSIRRRTRRNIAEWLA
jgi:hypothetical protein